MVGEGGDEGRAASACGEGVGCGVLGAGERAEVSAGVADLDAETAGGRAEDKGQPEAAAGHAAVQDGVGGQLRDDECGTVREVLRDAPGTQLGHREEPGETGAAPRGRQQLGEGAKGGARVGCCVVHALSVAAGYGRGRAPRPVRGAGVRRREARGTPDSRDAG